MKRIVLLLWLCIIGHSPAWSLSKQQVQAMVSGDNDSRIEALQVALKDADEKTANFLKALADDEVMVSPSWVVVVKAGVAYDPVTGEAQTMPADLQALTSNNRMRSEVDSALAALQLLSKDDAQRLAAAKALLLEPDVTKMALLLKALGKEENLKVKEYLTLAKAAISIASEDVKERLEAAAVLALSKTPHTLLLLNQQLSKEQDNTVKAQLQTSIKDIKASLVWGERIGTFFTGLSLGSILLLVALGLAITYGLMGVINMAHGELMMIGAYATYSVQVAFRAYWPEGFDFYLLAALPASFLAAALVGAMLEKVILRHLYGRPLETLLATWGISLALMQGVRTLYGAQNVAVENPSWMSGGLELLSNLTLPWNRMIIIVFALMVLISMALLIGQTRLGLFVRGVTQNRPMASCMGINTARIDTYAFSLGSGIAGLAGCALSQIGNVGPDLGQGFIVDAFMVVVLGGVGQLMGTVYAALGLGVLNKLLEGLTGAVLAKIAVLVLIIVFIQKRPQGLFALKGRSAEA